MPIAHPILAIVPARGGSKGVPRKNIAPLAGRPLLAWTADTVRQSHVIDRAVLTTDDDEIAEVGRAAGLDVPFMRPPELARDDTPTLPVLQHVVDELLRAEDWRGEAVVLLEPTCPLRRGEDVDRCVSMLFERDATAVVTVEPIPPTYNPHWALLEDDAGRLRWAMGEREPIPSRQRLPEAWHRSGAIYVIRTDVLMAGSLYGDSPVGYKMPAGSCPDINTQEDFDRVARRIERGGWGEE
jgi:CMP-N-acetylneuraminic acid synthetase